MEIKETTPPSVPYPELLAQFNGHSRESQIELCLYALDNFKNKPAWKTSKSLQAIGIDQDVINEGVIRYLKTKGGQSE